MLQNINNGITAPLLQRTVQCCRLVGFTLHCSIIIIIIIAHQHKAAGVQTKQGVYNGIVVHSDDNVLRKETAFPY